MLKKIWTIFIRDIKVNTREALPLFVIIFPLLFAIGINLIVPGINDTTVNVAFVKNENAAQTEYFDKFAHVELFDDRYAVEKRVMERDSILGIVMEGKEAVILAQGNEPETVIEYTKLIKSLFDSGALLEDARTQIVEFDRTIPPLKKLLVNVLLLMNAAIAGMIITLNILEEKSDRTVSAVNVTPVSRIAFILGKSLVGMVLALILTVVCIFVTGFYDINIGQAILVVLATAILSMMIGFVQGVNSNDVMEAAGSFKLIFLPLAGSVVGYELVSVNWQIFFYWSPFYWAYRANDMILSKSGVWPEILLCIGAICVICSAVYALLGPRIRKGLQ